MVIPLPRPCASRGPLPTVRRPWRRPATAAVVLALGFARLHAEPGPGEPPPEVAHPPAPPMASPGNARPTYLVMGLLVHDPGGMWSRAKMEPGADANLEILFGRFNRPIWKGTLMPNAGITLNSLGYTAKLYGGALYELERADGVFVNAGVGLAVHNGRLRTTEPTRKQLGSRILFHIPFEAGFTLGGQKRLSLFFDHVSNGYTFRPNEGLDTIGMRLAIPF